LITEREKLQNELLVVSELMHQCISENAHIPLDQVDYLKRYDDLADRFEKAKARLEAVTGEIKIKNEKSKNKTYLNDLCNWTV